MLCFRVAQAVRIYSLFYVFLQQWLLPISKETRWLHERMPRRGKVRPPIWLEPREGKPIANSDESAKCLFLFTVAYHVHCAYIYLFRRLWREYPENIQRHKCNWVVSPFRENNILQQFLILIWAATRKGEINQNELRPNLHPNNLLWNWGKEKHDKKKESN